uniref:mitochondrial protein C2orf69 homolog n=1 Tax=Myxine glutinosa TaxID=7769 RepID=UPI00358F1A1A
MNAARRPLSLLMPAVPGHARSGCQSVPANDLLLVSCSAVPTSHVLFFPGDVQNYRAKMAAHRDNFHWQRWSLEDTTELLSRRFPDSFVWLIPASRMHLQKFSCYDNFVTSNLFGAPKHSSNGHAFEHLLALLLHGGRQASRIIKGSAEFSDFVQEHNGGFSTGKSACDAAATKANDNLRESASPEKLQTDGAKGSCRIQDCLFQLPTQLTLVGFSKGCVVLNQLVYELSTAQQQPELAALMHCITDFFWLDGGHPGGSDTWVTAEEPLRELGACGATVHVHVSPYQVQDPQRAWIGREQRRFVRTLHLLGGSVQEKVHFEDEEPSLEKHFRILEEF